MKSCGAGQAWNNALKTCVHQFNTGSNSVLFNRIYTTSPSGYQLSNNQYDHDQFNYGYYNNFNSNNARDSNINVAQPQYYIDANNNMGVSYASAFPTFQNDQPSRSRSTRQSPRASFLDQNSLWNTLARMLQSSAQSNQQGSRTQYRRSTHSFNEPAAQNTLWNSFAGVLLGNTNTVSGNSASSTPVLLVDANKMNMAYDSTSKNYNLDTMAASQRQAPSVVGSISQPVLGFDIPELCRDADTRYIAVLNDYHHFYECVRGTAQIRTCPTGEVWIHPLRKCVNLNDQSNQIASHNPCIGSDLRFHPYPDDPTKYVECQSWYRVYVWRCKDGLWAQNKQQCSTPNSGGPGSHYFKSYTPTNGEQNSRVVQYFPGYCDKTSFYYAHQNPAKYVQCDEFGKWFLKDCARNTTWDDSIKTCVLSLSSPGPEAGMTSAVSVSRMERASRQLPDDRDASLQSYPCPPNFAWDISRSECVSTSLSDFPPTCPRGYMWDEALQECVMYMDTASVEAFPDADYARPNCAAGHRWDHQTQMCVETDVHNTDYSNLLFEIDLDLSDDNPKLTTADADRGLSALPNLCETSSDRYHFAYPGQPHLFIQCDHLGVMHTQRCGLHQIWNDDIMTCVSHPSVLPSDSRAFNSNSYQINNNTNTNSQPIMGDVCLDSNTVYYPYPPNKKMFIMCFNGMAHPMSCPLGTVWQDSITTCTRSGD